MNLNPEIPFPRPLSGAAVTPLPSGLVPARTDLEGQSVRLERIGPAVHAEDLYEASHTTEKGREVWTYLPEGPWPDRAAYIENLRANAGDPTRIFCAIRPLPDGPASGQASFMDIRAGRA